MREIGSPLVIIRGVDQRAARPFVPGPGLGRQSNSHVHAGRASPVFLSPASDRAAAAVAGPPLTVSLLLLLLLLLLSLTREKKKPVKKQEMYVILAKRSQT